MQDPDINRFCFLGEVTEVFHQDGQRWIRSICKPGRILIQVPEISELSLGDKIKVTCSIQVNKLEKFTDPDKQN
jgi:hypothetical protein